MGRDAKLKAKRRQSKSKGFSTAHQNQAVKPQGLVPVSQRKVTVRGCPVHLLPDLGQSVLDSGIPYHACVAPGCFIDGQFYREPNRLETSIDLPNYCATLVFPCETSGLAIQKMHFLKRDGFTGKLEPDKSLAYTTPRTKERVVPLRAVPD